MRFFLICGSIAAGLAVILGAFGAHALADRVAPARIDTFETGVRYQMYHALALLALAWFAQAFPSSQIMWAGYLFAVGIVVFSGSLYLLVLTDTPWLGAVTPIGGVAFIAGWLCVLWAVLTTAR
jgi:uncharacterized membrane protein YgdD (TMEM256/DUF423 family)